MLGPTTSPYPAYTMPRFAKQTKAYFWDLKATANRSELHDDASLAEKISNLRSTWHNLSERPFHSSSAGDFVLIVASGATAKCVTNDDPLSIRADTLRHLIDAVGFSKRIVDRLLDSWLPSQFLTLQYDNDREEPTSMTLVFRCPKNSNTVMCFMRVHFSTRSCAVFLSARREEDVQDILARCRANVDSLRTHPFYFLSLVHEHRYQRWTEWFSELWGSIALVETATRMTHPNWTLKDAESERLKQFTSASTLLKQLHATNTEFCHTHTVMESARKYGAFCLAAVDELERRREDLGIPALHRRDRIGLEENFKFVSMQLETYAERLSELQARLAGQITVSYNLIAQRNNEITLMIAKLQSRESHTLKGISILGLLFLPATLIATIWSTNLIHLDGDRNWQMYLGISVALTLLVFLAWLIYVRVLRVQEQKHWPVKDSMDLELSFV